MKLAESKSERLGVVCISSVILFILVIEMFSWFVFATVPEKRGLNEANMKNEIFTYSFSTVLELHNESPIQSKVIV